MVGVASFGGGAHGGKCGPDVNDGKGYFEEDTGVYVDVYKYVDWIRNNTAIGKARNNEIRGIEPRIGPGTKCCPKNKCNKKYCLYCSTVLGHY